MNKIRHNIIGALAGIMLISAGAGQLQAQYSQGFNGTALPSDWTPVNRSTGFNGASPGNPWSTGSGIQDADGNIVVSPYEGSGFAIVNYTSTASTSTTATISNWLLSPQFTIRNGDTFSFYTTTTPGSAYPDRLQFRLSTAGASINVGTTITGVGDFSTSLLDINPTLATGGYPETFTLETVTISGLAAPVTGRVAFRYFVTNGGTNGSNSNIIGVDSFSTTAAVVPEPSTYVAAGLGMMLLVSVVRTRRTARA